MQLHHIKPIHKSKHQKKIARGGKRGTTSGRGTKGQKSRAGAKIRPEIRDIIMKFPKTRGWSFKSKQIKPAVVNVGTLDKEMQSGALITPKTLQKQGLIKSEGGKIPEVKILGDGVLTKKFTFKGVFISKSAKEKIEAAGGAIQ